MSREVVRNVGQAESVPDRLVKLGDPLLISKCIQHVARLLIKTSTCQFSGNECMHGLACAQHARRLLIQTKSLIVHCFWVDLERTVEILKKLLKSSIVKEWKLNLLMKYIVLITNFNPSLDRNYIFLMKMKNEFSRSVVTNS
ncbi:hypothetical protein BpHYR1_025582 [Brachionus plicatilis]|uniref:Uncharacterized protein n=1 Tax=Brachionus plicatilis TaxID=10195 RepID=A0A3M7S4K0_BRAPC|nr:hypothetical protein BpHYR1_025582 [Brachionus plicatilis]